MLLRRIPPVPAEPGFSLISPSTLNFRMPSIGGGPHDGLPFLCGTPNHICLPVVKNEVHNKIVRLFPYECPFTYFPIFRMSSQDSSEPAWVAQCLMTWVCSPWWWVRLHPGLSDARGLCASAGTSPSFSELGYLVDSKKKKKKGTSPSLSELGFLVKKKKKKKGTSPSLSELGRRKNILHLSLFFNVNKALWNLKWEEIMRKMYNTALRLGLRITMFDVGQRTLFSRK